MLRMSLQLTVRTSDLPDAATRARIFVTLYGDAGDTGEHELKRECEDKELKWVDGAGAEGASRQAGTEGQRDRGTEGQRDRGTEEQRNRGTEGQGKSRDQAAARTEEPRLQGNPGQMV